MTLKIADKAFQFAVWTTAAPGKHIYLVEGASEPLAERRLRKELPPSANIQFQREANREDIARANLMANSVVKVR